MTAKIPFTASTHQRVRTVAPLLLCAALALCTPVMSQAQTIAPPSGVLSLDASASTEVRADIVRITLFSEQQGDDPATLSRALNQRTEAALGAARAQDAAKVSTGQFSIEPVTDRDGKITTWRGRSELIIESHDFEAASKLAGSLGDQLQVAGVAFSLSQAAQKQAESTLVKQAIASFRSQASTAAEAFGYKGFTVREVSISHSGHGPMPVPRMMLAMAAPSAKMAAVPIEAGMTTVTVSVNGAIQMVP